MKTLPNHCHHDVPSEASDCGEIMHQRAAEACGFDTTKDAFDAHAEMHRRGGPEAIVDRAAKRAEKAGQR
jgi:hypothetical protein